MHKQILARQKVVGDIKSLKIKLSRRPPPLRVQKSVFKQGITDDVNITIDDVYVVWSVKVLQNWKALISTTLPDGMYYELTYNGDKDEIYLDAYKKFDNVKISNEEKKYD